MNSLFNVHSGSHGARGLSRELIETLTQELGVKQEQAVGGVSLLFQLVKESLGVEEFPRVARLIPDLEEMVETYPEGGMMARSSRQEPESLEADGLVRNLLGAFAEGFLRLGLDSSMINSFIPFIVSYIRQKGGDQTNCLCQDDLK
jgi:hypothetical protein